MDFITSLFTSDPWQPACIRHADGEVFAAKFRIENGHVIVKTHTDRMTEGRLDGTTTVKHIAHWWPAVASADYIQWVASSAPSVRPPVPSV